MTPPSTGRSVSPTWLLPITDGPAVGLVWAAGGIRSRGSPDGSVWEEAFTYAGSSAGRWLRWIIPPGYSGARRPMTARPSANVFRAGLRSNGSFSGFRWVGERIFADRPGEPGETRIASTRRSWHVPEGGFRSHLSGARAPAGMGAPQDRTAPATG